MVSLVDTDHALVCHRASTAIGAAESGLLATVGVKEVLVHPAPRIAVLSTGGTLPPIHIIRL
jgi:molybdopterin biosynthesis enzyme